MLHFRPSNLRLPADPVWPSVTLTGPTTVFTERAPLRKLIVVIDNEIAEQANDAVDDELGLLLGLMSHPYIALSRYADDGPPGDAPRHTSPIGQSVPGWVIVGPPYADGFSCPVLSSDGDTIREAAFLGDPVRSAERDDATPVYSDLDEAQARTKRRADAVAVRAAFAAGADLFITRRPYLHAITWDLGSGVLVARPEGALALVALYLRAQGVFDTYRSLDGHATSSVNRGLFYWYGARGLLPAGWRWHSAWCQHARGDTGSSYLAQSAFTRVQRALEARDLVHRTLNQPQHNDTAELALSHLDVVLITLMGALDVTARVAHRALELPRGRERSAGWHRSDWLKLVERLDPALARSFAPETWNGTVAKLLSELRKCRPRRRPGPARHRHPGARPPGDDGELSAHRWSEARDLDGPPRRPRVVGDDRSSATATTPTRAHCSSDSSPPPSS